MQFNPITPVGTVNTTATGFIPFDGEWEQVEAPVKASIAFAGNVAMRWEIVANDVTGDLYGASNNSGVNSVGSDFFGILVQPIRATDPDYATAHKSKLFYVPRGIYSRAYATIGTGTFTAADVGKMVAIHSDSASIACDTKGLGCRIVAYISSTKAVVEFCAPNTLTA